MMDCDPNYYEILEIDSETTTQKIKQAFRRLAKKYHPDKNKSKNAETHFRRICTAYETLIDQSKRWDYDFRLEQNRHYQRKQNSLDKQRQTQQTQEKCDLMFQSLIGGDIKLGIDLYEQLCDDDPNFCFDDFLEYSESRDCEFLIAEAYETNGDHRRAIAIYENLIELEKLRPNFHHFVNEINDRLKKLYIEILTNPEKIRNIPNDLQKMEEVKMTKRERAWIYRRVAELYAEKNQLTATVKMLKIAIGLYPKLPGVKRICEQYGFNDLLKLI